MNYCYFFQQLILVFSVCLCATKYGKSFPRPARPGIYASDIDTKKYASLDNRKKEAVQKATIYNW